MIFILGWLRVLFASLPCVILQAVLIMIRYAYWVCTPNLAMYVHDVCTQVSDKARTYGELGIGVVDAAGAVRLGERAIDVKCLGPEDRVVVLADD